MPWLFSEDAALKAKLQGIVVHDANAPGGRTVPVRYRLPETEVGDLSFPIIIISHAGWSVANEREHRGLIQIPYAPEGEPTWWDDSGGASVAEFQPEDSPYWSQFPIPYNFDYEISVYARIMHEHTMPIIATLAGPDYLHAKFGYLDVPQDGTKRTMQLLGGPVPQTTYDENGKRIFIETYMVRVFSELVPNLIQSVLTKQVNLDLNVYTDTADLTGKVLTNSKGLLSVGTSLAWNVS